MKSFLLRFKGTIFASAQIQKMTAKMSEKIMWSTFTGHLTEFELKNPLEIFMDERNVHLLANLLGKALNLAYIWHNIFWISIFNTCSYGELFTGVSLYYTVRFSRESPNFMRQSFSCQLSRWFIKTCHIHVTDKSEKKRKVAEEQVCKLLKQIIGVGEGGGGGGHCADVRIRAKSGQLFLFCFLLVKYSCREYLWDFKYP